MHARTVLPPERGCRTQALRPSSRPSELAVLSSVCACNLTNRGLQLEEELETLKELLDEEKFEHKQFRKASAVHVEQLEAELATLSTMPADAAT
jgi:hypothetical protein